MNDLDKQVAEARGWEYIEHLNYYRAHNKYGWGVVRYADYHPRTNIAQAMELLEECEQAGMDTCVVYHPEIKRYEVHICPIGKTVCSGWGDTRQAAICHAFLKAKGKEAQDG